MDILKKNIFFLTFLFLITSCYVEKNIRCDYTQCYNPVLNNIKKYCKTEGFYNRTKGGGNSAFSIMLYEDGTVTCGIKHYLKKREVFRGNDLYRINSVPSWGTYIIKNKYLVVQKIDFSFIGKSNVIEYKIKIVNDTTLWLESSRGLTKRFFKINDSTKNDYIPYLRFIPLKNKPDSLCWLKEKKWFWCDKQKYKQYKKWLREQKRKRKQTK